MIKKFEQFNTLNEGGLTCIKLKDGKYIATTSGLNFDESGNAEVTDVHGEVHTVSAIDLKQIYC